MEGVDKPDGICDTYHMAYKALTDLLREKLNEVENLNDVSRDTGLIYASLMRFRRGDQSLRLDMADLLCEYFGIEHVSRKRKGQ